MSERTITEISIDELYDSPFNPPDRATLRIDEMAANIQAAGGVLQPALVRPRFVHGGQQGYEIVYGHRRRYGAERAGLHTLPCEVRALTDAEVRAAQAAENVQRENLKALEEATAYQSMIDNDGLTPDGVAAAIGKSRSHVYGRLRLLDLCDQVRQALVAGDIKAEVALLIARVGDEKMQGKALAAIKGRYFDLEDGGAKSYRQVRELLNEKFTLALDKAIFPIASADLVPSAGSCTECAKRTGNAPEYSDVAEQPSKAELEAAEDKAQKAYDAAIEAGDEDVADRAFDAWQVGDRDHVRHGGPMVCTDPDCFEAKKKAHLKAEAARLEREGATVIAGGKARQAVSAQGELSDAFIAADQVGQGILTRVKGEPPVPVTIQNPRDGTTITAYRAEDLQAAGVKVKPKKKPKSTGYDPQADARKQARQREEAEHEAKARRALLDAVREAAGSQPRSEFDLRLVARAALDGLDHREMSLVVELHAAGTVNAMRKAIERMDADACARLLLDCALVAHVQVDPWTYRNKPEALLAAAAHYGIDVEAARASAVQTPASEEEPAPAPAKKKGSKKRTAAEEQQAELL